MCQYILVSVASTRRGMKLRFLIGAIYYVPKPRFPWYLKRRSKSLEILNLLPKVLDATETMLHMQLCSDVYVHSGHIIPMYRVSGDL